jgi:hypothetical protein
MFTAKCSWLVILAGWVSVLGTLGCNKNPESRYIPSGATARESVEAALNAWKNGEPPGSIKLGEKPVNIVDSRWQRGTKLESFQVTEELAPNPHPSYKVKLQFAKETASSETTYLVIGLDPLLIYRSEDYERERKAF